MNAAMSRLGTLRLPKPVWAVAGVASASIGLWLGIARHDGVWPFVAGAVAPDLALLVGIGSGMAKGQLHPRAVPIYNAVHSLALPILLGAATLAFGLDHRWLVLAFAWLAHIAIDRAVGYGMRNKEGFQRG